MPSLLSLLTAAAVLALEPAAAMGRHGNNRLHFLASRAAQQRHNKQSRAAGTQHSSKKAQKAGATLPEVCTGCGPSMHDPFSDKYCTNKYDECGCCRQKVQEAKAQLCLPFVGYGSCEDGVAAKTAEVEACIAKAQQHKSSEHDLKKKQIEQITGKDLFKDTFLQQQIVPSGVYSSECISDCTDNKALCAFDFGCSRALEGLVTDLGNVKRTVELHDLKHQEWLSVYNGLCPAV